MIEAWILISLCFAGLLFVLWFFDIFDTPDD